MSCGIHVNTRTARGVHGLIQTVQCEYVTLDAEWSTCGMCNKYCSFHLTVTFSFAEPLSETNMPTFLSELYLKFYLKTNMPTFLSELYLNSYLNFIRTIIFI